MYVRIYVFICNVYSHTYIHVKICGIRYITNENLPGKYDVHSTAKYRISRKKRKLEKKRKKK